MDNYENLLNEAAQKDIKVIENYPFKSNCEGMAVGNKVALSQNLATQSQKTTVLAEELGHYHTTVGNILDQASINSRKQEYQARMWAYNHLIGLNGIINSYKARKYTLHDMADYLEVTEEFLLAALNCYKSKYGECVQVDNYAICFEPNFGVIEITAV